MIRRAEAQRVHGRDRPGAHGEDIAQDAADAGGSPLVGLDVGGVVVAFHLEDDAIAIADIDHAGVLAGTLDHARAGGRQGSEPLLRGFVGAVLVPHGREDAELGEGRFTPDEIENALVFLGLEPVGGNQLFGDGNDVWNAHGGGRPSCPARGCAYSAMTGRLAPVNWDLGRKKALNCGHGRCQSARPPGTGQQPVPPDAQREMSPLIRPASGEVESGP
jgi:hypothetical protein